MTLNSNLVTFLSGVNPWWDDKKYRFKIKPRNKYVRRLIASDNRLVKILIGARRIGKTSILQSTINSLLKTVKPKKILFLPADLLEIRSKGIRYTLEYLAGLHNLDLFKDEIYVFIDEVQEINGWQNDVKLLYDNTKIRFYLTGSSSLILKKETSKLTGRFLLTHVLPLNFNEFKRFTPQKDKTEKELLEDYLITGGYPEYVITRNATYLQQAIESTLYRELLDYYGIRNPRILSDLLKFLADKVTTTVSASRIAKDLKIDDKTAKFYLEYLQSVYLIYPVYRSSGSNKITNGSIPKYYFNDTGVLTLYGIRSRIGHLVENSVFVELLRNSEDSEVNSIFYDVMEGQEVDFKYKGNLFEVKGYDKLTRKDIDKYDINDKEVNMIINGDEIDSLPYSSNIKYIALDKFLKNSKKYVTEIR